MLESGRFSHAFLASWHSHCPSDTSFSFFLFFFLSFFLHIICLIFVLLREIIQQTQYMKVKLPCNMPHSTSALEVGRWSTSRPGRLIPAKETRYPFYRSLDGPRGRKILLIPGVEPITFQPVASRYTEYAIPDSISIHSIYKKHS